METKSSYRPVFFILLGVTIIVLWFTFVTARDHSDKVGTYPTTTVTVSPPEISSSAYMCWKEDNAEMPDGTETLCAER